MKTIVRNRLRNAKWRIGRWPDGAREDAGRPVLSAAKIRVLSVQGRAFPTVGASENRAQDGEVSFMSACDEKDVSCCRAHLISAILEPYWERSSNCGVRSKLIE